jgi:hypothetical protein
MTTDADRDEISGWLIGRLPDEWFQGPPDVSIDREEIVVIGDVGDVELEKGASDAAIAAARDARIVRFRESTRQGRMRIADEAEHRFGRKVAWGARSGNRGILFTSLSVPVMTRLRQPERRVLDTLVDAGVARSRSDALAWCVKLVRAHESEWIDKLRESLVEVERIRAEGPTP